MAFDPHRGRLWIVCVECGRWNLTPLETRWEALEELERLSRRRARLLVSTDNIALFEFGELELVRVGRTTLREEAWWRYGAALREREDRARRARKWGKIVDATLAAAVIGIPVWGWRSSEYHVERIRRRQFGRHAWPEATPCRRCGRAQRRLSFEATDSLRLAHDASGRIALWVYCERCGGNPGDAGAMVRGAAAGYLLRRVLAYRNFAGAPASQIDRAADIVTQFGSGAALTNRVAATRTFLASLAVAHSLALEIAVNEERERELLLLEATSLDERWLEEERIAAIVDRELS